MCRQPARRHGQGDMLIAYGFLTGLDKVGN
jgi:hypothetical protein